MAHAHESEAMGVTTIPMAMTARGMNMNASGSRLLRCTRSMLAAAMRL